MFFYRRLKIVITGSFTYTVSSPFPEYTESSRISSVHVRESVEPGYQLYMYRSPEPAYYLYRYLRATNSEVYVGLPIVMESIRGRRLRLTGHIDRHNELISRDLLFWDPLHGSRGRGRPKTSYIDVLRRDTGLEDPGHYWVHLVVTEYQFGIPRKIKLRQFQTNHLIVYSG